MHKELSPEYNEYMKSYDWQQVRELILERDNRTCQLCKSRERLEVHHFRYDHIRNERNFPEDLICLCHDCHEKITRYEYLRRYLKQYYNQKRREMNGYPRR